MFGEMLYAFDHIAKHFVEQSNSFLHPRMRNIELLRAKKSLIDSAKSIGGVEWFSNTCTIHYCH